MSALIVNNELVNYFFLPMKSIAAGKIAITPPAMAKIAAKTKATDNL